MADGTQAGPLCQATRPLIVEDGTAVRLPSPRPGPLCPTRPGGFGDYARRLRNVKDAFLLGLRDYAYRETVAKLGSDLRLLIDSLWPGFLQALKVYAWTIGTGAVLFGVAGAVLGEGVGAAPGALIGMNLGAQVGTFILELLGLGFLVEYVLAHLHEAAPHFRNGYDAAWQACGDPPQLGGAAREFGKGMADLLSLVPQAAAALVLKKGLTALKDLEKSKGGQALALYAGAEYWRVKLGLTDAPVPRRGIARTLEFFRKADQAGRIPPMTEADMRNYWKGMDFSREVEDPKLGVGKILEAHRDPAHPFGYFYTEPGTFLDRLGIEYDVAAKSADGELLPNQYVPRQVIRYRVIRPVKVLKSIASGVRAYDPNLPVLGEGEHYFVPGARSVPGGGVQYFIPQSWEVLEVIDAPPRPRSPIVVPKSPDRQDDEND